MELKHKEEFLESIKTLLYSWGGDTPSEVYWGLNELLDWYEMEFEVKLPRFEENEDGHGNDGEVLKALGEEENE
jgi:hypothetical protein